MCREQFGEYVYWHKGVKDKFVASICDWEYLLYIYGYFRKTGHEFIWLFFTMKTLEGGD